MHYTELLRGELARAHDVLFIPFTRPYPRWLYPGEVPDDARAPAADGIDWARPLSWERAARRIRDWAPNVLVVPWWTTFWTPATLWLTRRARAARIPVLFICHNVVSHENRSIDRLATRAVLRGGSHFFVHSADEAKRLRDLIGAADVHVVPHPSYAHFNTGRYGRDDARARLRITGEMLLFFGFVRPYKGLRPLLQAMAQRELHQRDAHLYVVGEFWDDRASYDRLIADLGLRDDVTVVDRYVPEDEMELWFAAADVVTLPYLSVTGSGAAQLAVGFRRPIVASAVGDLADVVKDGVNGYLVPPNDPAALARAIATALDQRETLQRGADARPADRPWSEYVRRIGQLAAGARGA